VTPFLRAHSVPSCALQYTHAFQQHNYSHQGVAASTRCIPAAQLQPPRCCSKHEVHTCNTTTTDMPC
jgi:hypothetical protein